MSETSRSEAVLLIPREGDLGDPRLRAIVIDKVATALDKAFAEGVEHVEGTEFLQKVADLAKRP